MKTLDKIVDEPLSILLGVVMFIALCGGVYFGWSLGLDLWKK